MYDPVVKGYSETFFKTITGTPSTDSGNLRFTAEEATSYSQYVYGDYTFAVNVPNSPSGSESRVFGLRNNAHRTFGGAYFEVASSVFKAVTYDDTGTVESTAITWDSRSQTWAGVVALFRILWTKQSVKFYVTTLAAPLAEGDAFATHETSIPNSALAINFANAESDNMDVDWFKAERIGLLIS